MQKYIQKVYDNVIRGKEDSEKKTEDSEKKEDSEKTEEEIINRLTLSLNNFSATNEFVDSNVHIDDYAKNDVWVIF